ncbi:MAG: translation initiation factor IF-2 subunit alpha [Candidatus Woesearchaeota archaeon]
MRLKQGFPEEGELVLCKVTNIQFHSVFCNLEEYVNKSGMIHISEVSPGRIRNIREYVKEGKVIVCKVLRINLERGHIDLSLRRVSEGQRRQKSSALKQEQKAEKIVESVAQQLKMEPEKLMEELYVAVKEHSEYLYPIFEAVVEEGIKLSDYSVPKAIIGPLEAAIKDKIKPKEVLIRGDLKLATWAPDGVEVIRSALQSAEKAGEGITLRYLGAGAYGIQVQAKEFKEAEKILKEATESAIKIVEKSGGEATFHRIEAA